MEKRANVMYQQVYEEIMRVKADNDAQKEGFVQEANNHAGYINDMVASQREQLQDLQTKIESVLSNKNNEKDIASKATPLLHELNAQKRKMGEFCMKHDAETSQWEYIADVERAHNQFHEAPLQEYHDLPDFIDGVVNIPSMSDFEQQKVVSSKEGSEEW
eukprot:15364744-Ditylum_brightwellii.AAC.1